jgi:hypothetical protein
LLSQQPHRPLHVAAAKGFAEVCELLIDHVTSANDSRAKAVVNNLDRGGRTPLLLGAFQGCVTGDGVVLYCFQRPGRSPFYPAAKWRFSHAVPFAQCISPGVSRLVHHAQCLTRKILRIGGDLLWFGIRSRSSHNNGRSARQLSQCRVVSCRAWSRACLRPSCVHCDECGWGAWSQVCICVCFGDMVGGVWLVFVCTFAFQRGREKMNPYESALYILRQNPFPADN